MKRQLITRENDNHTLEAIRSAVDKMVVEIGYDNMTIRGICDEVGIAIGTFYHYFSMKELLTRIMKDIFGKQIL